MAATFDFATFLPRLFEGCTLFIQLGCFLRESLFLYFKSNHKVALRFAFTQIIVLLTYRCNEDDIRQTSALPIQKNTYQSDTKANFILIQVQ